MPALLGVGDVSVGGRVLPAAEGLRLAGLAPFTLEYGSRVTGVPAHDIAQAARWYARPAGSQGSREGGGAPFSQ